MRHAFLVIDAPQLGAKGDRFIDLLCEQGLDAPILDRDESFDLALAVDHQAQCRGLHPPRREALHAADAPPQQRADRVTDQAIEDPPRLLRLDQRVVERTRMGKGARHGFRGDLVKGNAANGRALGQRATHHLQHVPGNGLPLAI